MMILLAALLAAPQDVVLQLHEPAQEAGGEGRFSLGIHLQILPVPSGDVDNASYDDLFGHGVGLSLEGDYLFPLQDEISWGGYLSLGTQAYLGRLTADIGALSYEMDSIATLTMIVGAKVASRPPKGFQWEGRAGIGFVHYTSTDGQEFNLFGTPGPELEVIAASTTGIFELGGRVGLGLGPKTSLQLGMLLHLQGGPDAGDVDFDGGLLAQFGIDLGVLLRF